MKALQGSSFLFGPCGREPSGSLASSHKLGRAVELGEDRSGAREARVDPRAREPRRRLRERQVRHAARARLYERELPRALVRRRAETVAPHGALPERRPMQRLRGRVPADRRRAAADGLLAGFASGRRRRRGDANSRLSFSPSFFCNLRYIGYNLAGSISAPEEVA